MHAAAPQPEPQPCSAVEMVARLWTGRFDNHRQVRANLARGGPAMPELTREPRSLEVVRLEAPQLGEVVLYLQECRASVPRKAHRQRVLRLLAIPSAGVADPGGEDTAAAAVCGDDGAAAAVLVEQLFFRDGPTYDRPLLEADRVAAMGEEAFQRYPGCDLLVSHDPVHHRWRGSMRPGCCRYGHPLDGEVCAEFAMLLSEGQHWYRDRSLRVADGRIRGEVDGFSWLLFDRLPAEPLTPPGIREASQALPALAEQMGVWEGTFRRYDSDGVLQDCFASTVVQGLEARDGCWHYSQLSLFPAAATGPRRIEAQGVIEGGRLLFHSERLRGWAMDVPDAPGTVVLLFESLDGSGLAVQEISQLSEGGQRRLRTSQTLRHGQLLSRTHIDEVRTSRDGRSGSMPPVQA